MQRELCRRSRGDCVAQEPGPRLIQRSVFRPFHPARLPSQEYVPCFSLQVHWSGSVQACH